MCCTASRAFASSRCANAVTTDSVAARVGPGCGWTSGRAKIKDVRKPLGFVKGTGWPGGATFAVLFTLLEVFGGIALILGFLTQIVAVLFVLEMTATTVFSKTKLKRNFMSGYELDVAYASFALVLALLGPGAWSLDHLLGWA